MQVTIEVPEPKLGRRIYVPTTSKVVGGLGTICFISAGHVYMKEAPGEGFEWPMLVKQQLTCVALYGGSKMRPRLKKAS